MKLIVLINVKMPTVVCNLTIISRIITAFVRVAQQEKSLFFASLPDQFKLSRDVSMAMISGRGA